MFVCGEVGGCVCSVCVCVSERESMFVKEELLSVCERVCVCVCVFA